MGYYFRVCFGVLLYGQFSGTTLGFALCTTSGSVAGDYFKVSLGGFILGFAWGYYFDYLSWGIDLGFALGHYFRVCFGVLL